jgi:hypothetical protein
VITGDGDPLTQEEIDDLRGESRWPPTLVLLVAIVVPLLLPDRFSLTPKWIGPALLALLLVAHMIADPGRIDRQSNATRAIGIGLMAVLVVGAATQAVVLTVELVGGNKALNNADALLSSGALVWVNTIIAFAFVYWEIDGGGPAARAHRIPRYPHLAFPAAHEPWPGASRLAAAVPRLSLPGSDERHRVQPDRRHADAALGQADHGRADLDLADHPRAGRRTRGEHPHLKVSFSSRWKPDRRPCQTRPAGDRGVDFGGAWLRILIARESSRRHRRRTRRAR